MHPVDRICSRLAEESRLIDRRILVLSQMATAWRSIPLLPGPSSVSVATQTVERTYVDASVEAISVHCMPRAEFLAKMRELVQENAHNRIYALLREMRSVEAVGIRASRSGTGCRQSQSYATLMSKRPG